MAEFDTAALMDSIIRDAKVPKGSSYRTASTLLGMCDAQLRTLLVPELLKAPGDLLVTRASLPLVAEKASYRRPSRLLRLVTLSLVNAAGQRVADFSRATPEQADTFNAYAQPGRPRWWHLEGGTIRVHPTPDGTESYSLLLRYARRPSRLVEASACWTVAAIDSGAGTFTVTGGPGALTAGTRLDVVKATPDFHALVDDATAAGSLAGWTLSGLDVTELEEGDFVCPAGTSPVAQIPADYHPVLAQAVVAQIAKEQGDTAGEAAARQRLAELLATAQPILEPKAEEQEVCVQQDWL